MAVDEHWPDRARGIVDAAPWTLRPLTELLPKQVRPARRHRSPGRRIAALLAFALLLPVALFMADQRVLAPLIWGDDGPKFREVASRGFELVEPAARTLVVVVGGMGIRDATPGVAEPLIPSFVENRPGTKMVALREGARLNLPATYTALDLVVADNPAGTVVFYGMSTGTKEILYLAAHLRSTSPLLRIVLFADSGPIDAYSAFDLRVDPGVIDLGRWSARLRLFGGPLTASLVDLTSMSTRAKFVADDGSLRLGQVRAELGRIDRDIWTGSGTTNALRIGQLALIVDDSAAANLAAIAAPDQGPVWFFYLAPGADGTIDDAYAAARYAELAAEVDDGAAYHFVKIDLPGLPHASERLHPAEYNAAITQALARVGAAPPPPP